jgi:hypothetical protein
MLPVTTATTKTNLYPGGASSTEFDAPRRNALRDFFKIAFVVGVEVSNLVS